MLGFAGLTGRLKLACLQDATPIRCSVAVSDDTRNDHLRHLPGLKKGVARSSDSQWNRLRRILVIVVRQHCELRTASPWTTFRCWAFSDDTCLRKAFCPGRRACRIGGRIGGPAWHLVAVGSGDFLREYQAEVASRPELKAVSPFWITSLVPPSCSIGSSRDALVMGGLPDIPYGGDGLRHAGLGTDCVGLREVLCDSPLRYGSAE